MARLQLSIYKKLQELAQLWKLNIGSITWLLVILGVVLRTIQYGLNVSLWIDEAFISLNIIDRSFLELVQPLDYRQGAPLGFLWLEKSAVILLGTQEWVLRLVPFLASIASLLLFRSVALSLLSPIAATIALGLFALSDRLIYFAAEVKQYSSDVAIALLLLWASTRVIGKPLQWKQGVGIAALGAISLWLSHPAVFVLSGMGLTMLLTIVRQRSWLEFQKCLSIFVVWALSFISFYWVTLRPLTQNEALRNSFTQQHNAFMPVFPTSFSDINWYVENFFDFFYDPVGLPAVGLAALFFITGLILIWQQNKTTCFLLVSPICLTLLASGLHQYPFKDRLVTFLVPFGILILAEGAFSLAAEISVRRKTIGALLIGVLFFQPIYFATLNLRYPSFFMDNSSYQRVRENIRPVLAYIQENRQPGDTVYVYYAAQYAFKYYLEKFDFNELVSGQPVWPEVNQDWFEPALASYPPQLVVGAYSRDDWSIFQSELQKIKGNERVWVLFTHVRDRRSSIDEEDVFLHFLDQSGIQKDSFSDVESSVYLYDLSDVREDLPA